MRVVNLPLVLMLPLLLFFVAEYRRELVLKLASTLEDASEDTPQETDEVVRTPFAEALTLAKR